MITHDQTVCECIHHKKLKYLKKLRGFFTKLTNEINCRTQEVLT